MAKGTTQLFIENNPYLRWLHYGAVRGEPMTAEIMAAKRAYYAKPENVVTMSEPEVGYDFGPMDASGMGGYSQGGLFEYVPPATPRPEYRPPNFSAPDGNIPRQERAANAIQPQPQPVSIADETINNLMARLSGYYSEPEMPRKSDMLGDRPPVAVPGYAGGMFSPRIDPDVPSPNMNLSIQNYPQPDMFTGRLPQPPIPKAVRGGFTGELPMPGMPEYDPGERGGPIDVDWENMPMPYGPDITDEEVDYYFNNIRNR